MGNISNVIPAQAGNAYAYDNVGNRTSMTVTAGGVTRTHVYTYDNIMSLRAKRGNLQVTGVDYPPELSYLATDTTFNYDAAGNRTSVIDGSGTCTYTTNNLNEYTAAGTSSYEYDASGNMTADGTYSFFYDPENRLIRTTKSGSSPTRTLGQALDCRAPLAMTCSGLTYTTGGEDGWRVDYYEDYQGMCSARSGYIGDEEESYLQTQVQGAGTIKFWWKVSSEDDDYLEFWIDTTRQDLISGSVGWQEKTFTVSGTGTHTLKWRYIKDGSDYAGDDCGWVDWVQWSGSCPPVPEPASNNWGTLLYRERLRQRTGCRRPADREAVRLGDDHEVRLRRRSLHRRVRCQQHPAAEVHLWPRCG